MLTNANNTRYFFRVEPEITYDFLTKRPAITVGSSVGEANKVFTLVSIDGLPNDPDGFHLKLIETGETVTLSKSIGAECVLIYLPPDAR